MLELAIRTAHVDLVPASAETPLETRMVFVEHKLGQADIGLLGDLVVELTPQTRTGRISAPGPEYLSLTASDTRVVSGHEACRVH